MKKFIKKLLGIKNQPNIIYQQNIYVGIKTLEDIKRWENQKNDLIIRSNFNRELYYKYLETIKNN